MIKNIKLLLTFIISLSSLSWGATFLTPLEIGNSAEMISIGNISGFTRSANGVFENPAALHYVKGISTSAFTTTFMDEVRYLNFAIASDLPFIPGKLGFGFMAMDIPDIAITTVNTVGEFVPSSFFNYFNGLAKLSYQFTPAEVFELPGFLQNLFTGASLTYYQNSFGIVDGTGINMDLGFLYYYKFMALSLDFKNVIPGMTATYTNGGVEELPMQITLGGAFRVSVADIFLQLKNQNNAMLYSLGATLFPSFLPYTSISMGYKQYLVLDQVQNNFTIGIGLNLLDVNFNYAFETSDHLVFNGKHYFSVSVDFLTEEVMFE